MEPKQDALFFQQLEWNVNIKNNTIYLNWELELSDIVSIMGKIEGLLIKNGKTKPINLVISSYGGDAYAMLGLIDYIKSLPVKVNITCYGACMSAAAVLLASGTGIRSASKNSTLMLHEGTALETGKTSDVLKGAEHLKVIGETITTLLGNNSKKPKKYWDERCKSDYYLSATTAKELGLIDKII